MKRGFSVYLDAVRVIACLIVFAHHLALNFGCYKPAASGCGTLGWLIPFHAGHSAVVVFFVLSGYVISYVASERETTLQQYALSRCARIYSVAVPALLLTMILDLSSLARGNYWDAPLYQYNGIWKYLPLFLTFTTDHWFLGENAFSHGGWWSLSYEVWFYIVFAGAFYLRGWQRWAATALVLLLIGPKLWALLLCWLLGCGVYWLHRNSGIRLRFATPIMIASISLVIVIMHVDGLAKIDQWANIISGGSLAANMRYSQWFVGDLVLAALFAASVFAAKFAALGFGRLARPIKYMASITFTFYMVHGLIIFLCINDFDLGMLQTILAVFVFTVVFARYTEHQKDRLHLIFSAALSAAGDLSRRWWVMLLPNRSM